MELKLIGEHTILVDRIEATDFHRKGNLDLDEDSVYTYNVGKVIQSNTDAIKEGSTIYYKRNVSNWIQMPEGHKLEGQRFHVVDAKPEHQIVLVNF